MKKLKKFVLSIGIILCILGIYCNDKEIDDIFPCLDRGIGHWERTGKLVVPRDGMSSMVKMGDGNILITGGLEAQENGIRAEIYYPRENVFRPTGNLINAKSGHTSYLLHDGRIVIIGSKDVEMYNPKTGSFIKTDEFLEPFDTINILLKNGFIFSQHAMYNPITKEFKKLYINYARITNNIIEGDNGNVYVVDGWVLKNFPLGKLNNTIAPSKGKGFILTNRIEKYNFKTNQYEFAGKSIIPKRTSALIRLPDGKILIIGGNAYGKAILEKEVFKNNINPVYKRYRHNKVYEYWQGLTQTIEMYDPKTETSQIVGEKLKYAVGCTRNSNLNLLKNRYILVASSYGRRFELIDSKTWKVYSVKKMPKKRLDASISIQLDENSVLFIGEFRGGKAPYGYVFKLDDIKE